VALLIQALFFGDGGILAYPVNAFNMALLLPFVAYGVYRLLARRSGLSSGRRVLAAAAGAYIGINVAALAAAIEFGVQPTLFHKADGTPLYAPFHLAQTIPAMLIPHLLVAGVVEAAVTGAVIAYLQRANVPLLRVNAPDVPLTDAEIARRPVRPVVAGLIGVGVMTLLTPLGLLAPGGAFGESAPAGLDLHRYGLSAVPDGLQRYSDFWGRAVLPGYGDGGAWQYLLSAVIGVVAAGLAVAAIAVLLRRRRGTPAPAAAPEPAVVGAGSEHP
jgi:cobalt/nickel transport system permease protein